MPVAVDVVSATNPKVDGAFIASESLAIVGELMMDLDVVTVSGRKHVMLKILSILHHEVPRSRTRLTTGRFVAVTGAMADLDLEAGRLMPPIRAFNRGVRGVVDELSLAWTDQTAR